MARLEELPIDADHLDAVLSGAEAELSLLVAKDIVLESADDLPAGGIDINILRLVDMRDSVKDPQHGAGPGSAQSVGRVALSGPKQKIANIMCKHDFIGRALAGPPFGRHQMALHEVQRLDDGSVHMPGVVNRFRIEAVIAEEKVGISFAFDFDARQIDGRFALEHHLERVPTERPEVGQPADCRMFAIHCHTHLGG